MKKTLVTFSIIFICLVAAGFAYWYFFFHGPGNPTVTVSTPAARPAASGFVPLNTSTAPQNNGDSNASGTSTVGELVQNQPTTVKIATLRMLSGTPVGGYAASTTASSTDVRWIDRGRGNVYELPLDTETVTTLSNTIVPRMYESIWNRNLNAFIGSILPDGSNQPVTIYAQLRLQASSTASTTPSEGDILVKTPYELKGTNLPDNVIAYAASPKTDKLFFMTNENGTGVGYISNFDGSKMAKIFDTPLTQVNVEWPEANTIAITTKGSASQGGFLYFVNAKTGVWKKILGPIAGLSTRVSHDARYVLASSASRDQNVDTGIYSVASSSFANAIVRTLADKCAWGNFYTKIVYCAAPSQPVAGTYPDDWYMGNLSTIDKIWQINAATGEIHLVTSIVDQSDRVIDAFNLGLDPKDDYLFFMNKNDLSLWSYDLVAGSN